MSYEDRPRKWFNDRIDNSRYTVLPRRTDFLKDRHIKLSEGHKPLTVIIGVKCNDGILIIGDTQFTTTNYHVTYDVKLFRFPERDDAKYILGLAGYRHAFEHTKHDFVSSFVNPVDVQQSLKLDRYGIEEKLKELSDRIYYYYHVERAKRSGREDRFPYGVIGGVFGAIPQQNANPELLVYNFSPYDEPDNDVFHAAGSGQPDALAVYHLIRYGLKTLQLDWNIFSTKLMGQIMMFAMRFVYNLNISVGSNYRIFTLDEKGCIERSLEYFYPRHFQDGVPYKNELLATALDILPDDKAQKLLEKFKFTP